MSDTFAIDSLRRCALFEISTVSTKGAAQLEGFVSYR